MKTLPLPDRAEKFVPHQPPMLLLDTLVSAEEEAGSARTTLKEDNLFLNKGMTFEECAFPELLAQTYAAVRGYALRCLERPLEAGFLVAVQRSETPGRAVAGDELTIHVRTVGKFGGFSVVEGEVCREEIVLASGKIKLFIPAEAQDETF